MSFCTLFFSGFSLYLSCVKQYCLCYNNRLIIYFIMSIVISWNATVFALDTTCILCLCLCIRFSLCLLCVVAHVCLPVWQCQKGWAHIRMQWNYKVCPTGFFFHGALLLLCMREYRREQCTRWKSTSLKEWSSSKWNTIIVAIPFTFKLN